LQALSVLTRSASRDGRLTQPAHLHPHGGLDHLKPIQAKPLLLARGQLLGAIQPGLDRTTSWVWRASAAALRPRWSCGLHRSSGTTKSSSLGPRPRPLCRAATAAPSSGLTDLSAAAVC